MIRIYDKEEKLFDNLGLGSLDETIAAVVVEELNGGYEMEMEYPITGRHFDKIQHRNIIFCKPNMYSDPQPFRIYSITKPLNGIVIINAEHISYDANGVTILPKRDSETKTIESFGDKVTVDDKEGYYLDTILRDINLSSAIQSKNRFEVTRGFDKTNVFKEDGYKIPAPLNLRSMLGGMSGSILEQFKGEYEFDRYNIILHNKRGVDRGITIRYGKNMTDLEHESEGNQLFTAIFPFYSKSYTETQTTTKPVFQDTYIIEGVTPRRADWLSIELLDVSKGIGGVSLKPVVELMKVLVDGVEDLVERYAPVIVKTPDDPEGTDEFYNKVYVFKRNKVDTENPELTNLFEVYVSQKHTETKIINEEEKTVEVIDEIKLDLEDNNPIVPEFGNIYIVKSEDSEHYNRSIIWDNGQFMEYSSDGFYVEAKDATAVPESTPLPTPIPVYPISWDENTSGWVKDIQNGWIYVTPKKPYVGTISVDKYVYLDLLEYALPDGSTTLLENGVIYVNEELKNLDNQKVLTLDMTEALDSIGGLEPTEMTQEHLFDKAEQYLKDNDLTKMKESVTISFIKLSDSPEYAHLKQLEIVELGDEINVIYEDLGINSKHRVISTEYNVLTDSYNEIELGDKASKITSNVVSVGDNISSLKNDEEFANKTYVVDFVAENAKIINAEIQNAIIKTLEAAHVNITNSLTASSAAIDQLVAEMLVSENAKIASLLEAGSIRVTGKITALSGDIGGSKIEDGKLIVSTSISIQSADGTTQFIVNEDGEVTANKLTITGGSIAIGKIDEFTDTFKVDENGKVIAKDAEIEGNVTVKEGSILIGGYEGHPNFEVDTDGKMTAKEAIITDGNITIKQGSIKLGGTEEDPNFEVDTYGKMTAKGVTINQGEIVIGESFASEYAYIRTGETEYSPTWLSLTNGGTALTPDTNKVYYILTEGDHWFKVYKWNGSQYILYERKYFQVDEYGNVVIGSGSININNNFMVDSNGNVSIVAGSINIGNGTFYVDNQGNLTANSVNIQGGKIDIYDPETGSRFEVTEGGNVRISGLAKININDMFEVAETGDVIASRITSDSITVADINSERAVIDDLTVGSIKFGEDGSVELRRESNSISESQTLTFLVGITSIQGVNEFNIRITVTEANGTNLWYNRVFNIGFTYYINYVRHSGSTTITIPAHSHTKHKDIFISGEGYAVMNSGSVFPKKLTEVRNLGNENKLVLVVDGISYDIAGENTGNAYLGLRVFLREDQPLSEEVSEGDFWYDID